MTHYSDTVCLGMALEIGIGGTVGHPAIGQRGIET